MTSTLAEPAGGWKGVLHPGSSTPTHAAGPSSIDHCVRLEQGRQRTAAGEHVGPGLRQLVVSA
ncbi:hypothetical protein H0H10_12985 [Streptomyces sp. TRM S81-3]|uniref:Uncharacterized protein n=1 Tax=Streptomyces griseicoloratus TaxID=2752516 RepID=A0A926L292_9ACTN|nr:hypothetical protein [Streptomyces griseicoloratus]MBD0420074.1 hypothetical protein [Streptomyces griseicoloratus]